MVSIRPMTMTDLLSVQNTNLLCLPENYQQRYFMYHAMSWPSVSFVAVVKKAGADRIVGYVLAKMENDDPTVETHGHITSLAVERSFRRRGIAQVLMEQTSQAMIMIYNSRTVTLHVRDSNRAAYSLYAKVLKFDLVEREVRYYADGEDGLFMRRDLVRHALVHGIQPADKESFFEGYELEMHNDGGVGFCEKMQTAMGKLSIQDDGVDKDGSEASQGGVKVKEEGTDSSNSIKTSNSTATATTSKPSSTSSRRSRSKSNEDNMTPAVNVTSARTKSMKQKMRKTVSNKSKEVGNLDSGAGAGHVPPSSDGLC